MSPPPDIALPDMEPAAGDAAAAPPPAASLAMAGAPPAATVATLLPSTNTAAGTIAPHIGPSTRRIAFVMDCTGSMSHQLAALLGALTEVVSILQVSCPSTLQLGILAYIDYCDPWVTRWSGWHTTAEPLVNFLKEQRAEGGGDTPEAAKTALKEVIGYCGDAGDAGADADGTVLFWYTDAPPHTTPTSYMVKREEAKKEAAKGCSLPNPHKELAVFRAKGWDHDWLALCREAAAARITAFPVFSSTPDSTVGAFFGALSDATGGAMVVVGGAGASTTHAFGAGTVGLVLSLMGYEGVSFAAGSVALRLAQGAAPPKHEADMSARPAKRDSMPLKPGDLPHLIEAPALAPAVRFGCDNTYKAAVYRAFQGLHVRSLTYNPLFAGLWRVICADRQDDRRQAVLDKFSSEVQGLSSETERAAVQAFLDLSYDQSDVVEGIIGACEQPLPAVIAPGVLSAPGGGELAAMAGMTPKEAMEMFRSCSPPSLKRLAAALTAMVVRTTPLAANGDGDSGTGEARWRAVPLALPERDFFSVLLHLVTPGLVLSRRASVVLALVALYVRAAPLVEKARTFVHQAHGRWIDWELPENFSLNFVKFVLKVHDAEVKGGEGAVLTAGEEKIYRHLRAIGGLKVNERSLLTVRLPFGGRKDPRPDTRLECTRCHGLRSFTVVDAEGVCGMCHWDEQERQDLAEGKTLPHGRDASSPPHAQFVSGLPEGRSYWCECRTCAAHYAVERIDYLNVEPKCHFCRSQATPAPAVRCAVCTNAFVCALPAPPAPVLAPSAPAGAVAAVAAGQWVCPPCAAAAPGCAQELEVSLRQYLEQLDGQHFLQPLGLTSKALFGSSLWDIGQPLCQQDYRLTGPEGEAAEEGERGRELGATVPTEAAPLALPEEASTLLAAAPQPPAAPAEEEPLPEVMMGCKRVQNLEELRAKVRGWVNAGVGELGTCAMCFDDVRVGQLRPACGRRGCRTTACNGCMGRWYGEPVPGCVLPLANLSCAFCKQRPAPATLRPFNREVLALRVPAEALGEGGQMSHYAWCVACYTAKPLAARECAAVAPVVQRWRCDECGPAAVTGARTAAGAAAGPRECPKCGVMVEKVSGCNHITCAACDAHWCYECGFLAPEAGQVYDHMYQQHGGFYGGEA